MDEIPLWQDRLEPEDLDAVAATLRSGWLTMGPRVADCETAVAEGLGRAHAVLVSSPTAALHLALVGLGVGPGDDVVVSALAPPAVAAATRDAGARAVVADIRGEGDLGIDPDAVAGAIGRRTRAVIVSHPAGYPAEVEAVAALCAERGLPLVEDACEAPLATAAGGRRCGAVGAAAALGFTPGSVLAAGRAGLLATDDAALADRARLLRSHGMTSGSWSRHTGETAGYDVVALGFNHRPDEPRAALVTSRWGRLEREVAARRDLTTAYRAALAPLAPELVPAFAQAAVARASCAAMVVLLRDAGRRDEVRSATLADGRVRTGTLAAPPAEGAPRARRTSLAAIALPLLPALGQAGVERVVGALAAALGTAAAR